MEDTYEEQPKGKKGKSYQRESAKAGWIPILHRQERIRSKNKDEQKGKDVRERDNISFLFPFFFSFFIYFSADFKTSIYNARSPVCYLT